MLLKPRNNTIDWMSLVDHNAKDAEQQKRTFLALDIVHRLPDDQRFVIKHLHGLLGCEPKSIEEVAKLMGQKTTSKVYTIRKAAYSSLRQLALNRR